MADAMKKGCKHILTCGGIQSNHCRATATAAVQLGLQPHLFLRGDVKVDSLIYFVQFVLGWHKYMNDSKFKTMDCIHINISKFTRLSIIQLIYMY